MKRTRAALLGVAVVAALGLLWWKTSAANAAERFVRPAHLDALDAYVSRRGLRSTFALVLGVRILAFGSFDVVSYGCGLTGFPWPWFAAATALGAVRKALAFSYAGATFAEPPTWLSAAILAGTFGFLLVVPWVLRRRRQSA